MKATMFQSAYGEQILETGIYHQLTNMTDRYPLLKSDAMPNSKGLMYLVDKSVHANDISNHLYSLGYSRKIETEVFSALNIDGVNSICAALMGTYKHDDPTIPDVRVYLPKLVTSMFLISTHTLPGAICTITNYTDKQMLTLLGFRTKCN